MHPIRCVALSKHATVAYCDRPSFLFEKHRTRTINTVDRVLHLFTEPVPLTIHNYHPPSTNIEDFATADTSCGCNIGVGVGRRPTGGKVLWQFHEGQSYEIG